MTKQVPKATHIVSVDNNQYCATREETDIHSSTRFSMRKPMAAASAVAARARAHAPHLSHTRSPPLGHGRGRVPLPISRDRVHGIVATIHHSIHKPSATRHSEPPFFSARSPFRRTANCAPRRQSPLNPWCLLRTFFVPSTTYMNHHTWRSPIQSSLSSGSHVRASPRPRSRA